MVTTIKHFSCPERLRRLGLPSLYYRRRRGDMVTNIPAAAEGWQLAVPPEIFLTRNVSAQTRGNKVKLVKPKVMLTYADLCTEMLSASGSSTTGTLLNTVVMQYAQSINQFKVRLDRHWGDIIFDTSYP